MKTFKSISIVKFINTGEQHREHKLVTQLYHAALSYDYNNYDHAIS